MSKISVILPTYNGDKFIVRAVLSVLEQKDADFELIIVDDSVGDDTEKIIQHYFRDEKRVRYIKNKTRLGLQGSLNFGLRIAQGEYIARIDDDDKWIDAYKLKQQVEFLESHLTHVLVGTGVVVADESGVEQMRYLLPVTDDEIRSQILGKNTFVHSSVMFRKKTVLNLGGYSEVEETRHVEDYDLWLKLGTVGKLANLHAYSVRFTLRAGNVSSQNKREQFRKDIQLIKKYKHKYPSPGKAFVRGYARLIFYGFFNAIPLKIVKNKILKLYKTR